MSKIIISLTENLSDVAQYHYCQGPPIPSIGGHTEPGTPYNNTFSACLVLASPPSLFSSFPAHQKFI